MPRACRSSQARDQTIARGATQAPAGTMLDSHITRELPTSEFIMTVKYLLLKLRHYTTAPFF